MAELFTVTDDCRRLGLRAGTILFCDVKVGAAPPELRDAIAHEAESVRQRFQGAADMRALAEVQAFQNILRKVGANPKRDQPSIERLLTYALKRGTLPAINSLVDTYNLVSLRTLCSLGAHDFDRLAPPISLRVLTGLETFTPLGSGTPEAVRAGEFGYVDGAQRVLCRLDVLQADFSKVTQATVNAVLIVEGTETHSDRALEDACTLAIETITRTCGGSAQVLARP